MGAILPFQLILSQWIWGLYLFVYCRHLVFVFFFNVFWSQGHQSKWVQKMGEGNSILLKAEADPFILSDVY